MFSLLCCKHTLLAHIKLLMNQQPQVILLRVAFNHNHTQLAFGIVLTQAQNFALGLVELHNVHMDPVLQLLKIPLDGISSMSIPLHSLVTLANLLRMLSIPLSMSPAEMLNSASPNTSPEETT
ncbi:hypothetical protein DUI87_07944 [Hirundo rustica rustica]|uniref:Uncharacterized protein n=1 Tax=Hirundo rustica rustica TaxID=333673 RepID=A0A3M0KYB2_HIRRU|nr:hypothetical protein DUI87_07944 [Hirundo rustica rustica]